MRPPVFQGLVACAAIFGTAAAAPPGSEPLVARQAGTSRDCASLGSTSGAYTIQCGHDATSQGDIGNVKTPTMAACLAECDNTAACLAVAYQPSSSTCYLKKAKGVVLPRLLVNYAYKSVATSTTPGKTCAAAGDGELYKGFTIKCETDARGLGDMGNVAVGSFTECIDECDKTPECAAVALWRIKSQCYLKRRVESFNTSLPVDFAYKPEAIDVPDPTPKTCNDFGGSYNDYTVQCGRDAFGLGDLRNENTGTFQACMDQCDKLDDCKAVSFVASSGQCYMKTFVEGSTERATVDFAFKSGAFKQPATTTAEAAPQMTGQPTSEAAPQMTGQPTSEAAPQMTGQSCDQVGNNAQYNGYTTACKTDAYGLGDIGNEPGSSFTNCMDQCDGITGCYAVTWVALSGRCYFKTVVYGTDKRDYTDFAFKPQAFVGSGGPAATTPGGGDGNFGINNSDGGSEEDVGDTASTGNGRGDGLANSNNGDVAPVDNGSDGFDNGGGAPPETDTGVGTGLGTETGVDGGSGPDAGTGTGGTGTGTGNGGGSGIGGIISSILDSLPTDLPGSGGGSNNGGGIGGGSNIGGIINSIIDALPTDLPDSGVGGNNGGGGIGGGSNIGGIINSIIGALPTNLPGSGGGGNNGGSGGGNNGGSGIGGTGNGGSGNSGGGRPGSGSGRPGSGGSRPGSGGGYSGGGGNRGGSGSTGGNRGGGYSGGGGNRGGSGSTGGNRGGNYGHGSGGGVGGGSHGNQRGGQRGGNRGGH